MSHLTELFILFVGLSVGSFLNVCIHRIPRGLSLISPGSSCPKCGKRIQWYENIPFISFILLRGRCSGCRTPIPLRYPIVEGLTGVAYLVLFWKYGLGMTFVYYALFISLLIAVSFIDLDHKIIPDIISIPGMVIGVVGAYWVPRITIWESLAGLLVGGGILFMVAWGYYLLTRREGMGGGDIKLLAMIGAFLGWQMVPQVLFLGALSGAVVGGCLMLFKGSGRHTEIPFGPFLSFGASISLFLPKLQEILLLPLK